MKQMYVSPQATIALFRPAMILCVSGTTPQSVDVDNTPIDNQTIS
jgi:hypothetical protein